MAVVAMGIGSWALLSVQRSARSSVISQRLWLSVLLLLLLFHLISGRAGIQTERLSDPPLCALGPLDPATTARWSMGGGAAHSVVERTSWRGSASSVTSH